MKFFGGVGCVTNNKRLDFGGRIKEFMTEFLPLRNRDNCGNFAGSAALAEFCGLRVLVVRS